MMMSGWEDTARAEQHSERRRTWMAVGLVLLLTLLGFWGRAHEAARGVPLYQPPAHHGLIVRPAAGEIGPPLSACQLASREADVDNLPCTRMGS